MTVDLSGWDPDASPPPARPAGELVLLANESMRARRAAAAVVVMWAWQCALAALVAWPAAVVVGSYYGRHPSGDAPLWQPGGLALADLFLQARAARAGVVTFGALVFLIAGFADLLPLGALFVSIGYVTRERRTPSIRAALGRAMAAFGSFVWLFAAASLVEGALVLVALAVFVAISQAGDGALGEARADQVGIVAALAVLGAAALVGVLHDLARAGVVRFKVGVMRAWRLALSALGRGPVLLLWSWAWRALASWGPVAVGGLVAARLGGRGGGALVALALVHQLVMLARTALRGSWLAAAMRAVDHAHRVVRARE